MLPAAIEGLCNQLGRSLRLEGHGVATSALGIYGAAQPRQKPTAVDVQRPRYAFGVVAGAELLERARLLGVDVPPLGDGGGTEGAASAASLFAALVVELKADAMGPREPRVPHACPEASSADTEAHAALDEGDAAVQPARVAADDDSVERAPIGVPLGRCVAPPVVEAVECLTAERVHLQRDVRLTVVYAVGREVDVRQIVDVCNCNWLARDHAAAAVVDDRRPQRGSAGVFDGEVVRGDHFQEWLLVLVTPANERADVVAPQSVLKRRLTDHTHVGGHGARTDCAIAGHRRAGVLATNEGSQFLGQVVNHRRRVVCLGPRAKVHLRDVLAEVDGKDDVSALGAQLSTDPREDVFGVATLQHADA